MFEVAHGGSGPITAGKGSASTPRSLFGLSGWRSAAGSITTNDERARMAIRRARDDNVPEEGGWTGQGR